MPHKGNNEFLALRNFDGIEGIVPWTFSISTNKFLFIGEEIKLLTGYNAEKFLESDNFIDQVIHPLDRFIFNMKDEIKENEIRFISKDLSVSWVKILTNKVKDKDFYSGLFIDITKQKTNEYESVQERIWLNLLLKTVNVGVVIEKINREIVLTNNKVIELFNLEGTKSKYLNMPSSVIFEEVLKKLKNPSNAEELFRTNKRDNSVSDVLLRCNNGLFIQMDCLPVQSKNTIKGNIWLFRDVTMYHHLLQKQEVTNNELKVKNDELNQFTSVVSHDLKAPLRAMGSIIKWIEESVRETVPDPEYLSEEFKLIHNRTKKLEGYITGLLKYNQAGNKSFEKSKVSVEPLLKSVVDNLKSKETIDIIIESNAPILETSDILLQQVFTNLISNAITYNDKETKGKIKIGYYFQEGMHHFYIDDNGPGIPLNQREKVFEIFKTLHMGKNDFDSSGIGLSVVKKIITQLGGKIWIEDSAMGGARFVFSISNSL
ncbi:MAG: PAS domain-containing sensor histidine kinase [Cyclobacteriaceae bacterium]|nr:PAS domain-containing sensor histidine kinase [Cyclobacteriaceae bacterium]